MTIAHGYAVDGPGRSFRAITFERRALRSDDVAIRIAHCGVCHTDVSLARNEWGISQYPMVPGHEITGVVTAIGPDVTNFAVGDRVGVGCFVDAERDAEEQYGPVTMTYNGFADGAPTYGGYADTIVVRDRFVVAIPTTLPLDATAPLLCAGTTVYSPLRHWQVGAGTRVAVVGIGGLGHLAIKMARAMGAEVTAIGRSEHKRANALQLGATRYQTSPQGPFDLVLLTASGTSDIAPYLEQLDTNGTLVLLGAPSGPLSINAFSLITQRRKLAGSYMGSMREIRDMLQFCAEHQIVADIERMPMRDIDRAFARLDAGDVRHRLVLDVERSL